MDKLRILERIKNWQVFLVAVLFSELFTFIFSSIQSFLRLGEISREVVEIGAVDAVVVSLIVTSMIVPLLRYSVKIGLEGRILQRDISERKRIEMELRESEEKYRRLIDTTGTGYVILNDQGRVTDSNQEYMHLTGRNELEDVIDHSILEWTAPYDLERNAAEVRKCIEQGSVRNFEIDYVTPSGTVNHVEINATVFHVSGTPLILTICRDITDRKRAEAVLLRSERRLSRAEKVANIGNWEISVGEQAVIGSEGARLIYGFENNESRLSDVQKIVLPEFRLMLDKALRELIGQGRPYDVEFKIRRPNDGRIIDIHSLAEYDSARSIVFGVIQDVTARKRADEALRLAEKRFRDILETVQLVAILLDHKANITFCNDYLLNLTGWKKEELLGRNWVDLFIPLEERDIMKTIFSLLIRGDKEVLHHENSIITRDGRKLLISWNNTVLLDLEGMISGTAGIGIDITEHRSLEAQLRQAQKMEAVGHLAGGIAHDFNNILSAIVGYAYLLQSRMAGDDPLNDDIEQILDSAQKAAEVTHSLLAFSKKQNINLKPLLITDVVKKFEKMLSRIIGEDIALSTELSCNKAKCMVDASQIEQVLMNLANNARDAMPDGGDLVISTECVKLDEFFIRTHGYGKLGAYALISVADTGIGMSPETAARIFEPFFTTKETGKGTGLGLAMAYGIIKQHDGYINVFSELGKGTTFKMYLPLVESKEEVTVKTIESLPSGGTETILVTEDDDKLRKLSEIVLKQYGYEVIPARDGEEAIEKFIENRDRIHLVLLDVIMPKKSGKEAYDAIRRVKRDMKVIFLSGYTADRMDKKILAEKNVKFIFKPLSPKDLLREVRAMLDK